MPVRSTATSNINLWLTSPLLRRRGPSKLGALISWDQFTHHRQKATDSSYHHRLLLHEPTRLGQETERMLVGIPNHCTCSHKGYTILASIRMRSRASLGNPDTLA